MRDIRVTIEAETGWWTLAVREGGGAVLDFVSGRGRPDLHRALGEVKMGDWDEPGGVLHTGLNSGHARTFVSLDGAGLTDDAAGELGLSEA